MTIGRVYKIIHNQSDICYIGSTFNTTRDRFRVHKYDYKQGNNSCSISKYFEKYGVKNFKMILIKEYEVIDREHLEAYEQLWINKLNCVNKQCAFQPLKKERIKIYHKKYNKEYYQKNKTNPNNYCDKCKYQAPTKIYLNKHLETKKHNK